MEPGKLVLHEWLMIILFLIGMIILAFRKRKQASEGLEESFLAGRKLPGFIASLSTVATNLNANGGEIGKATQGERDNSLGAHAHLRHHASEFHVGNEFIKYQFLTDQAARNASLFPGNANNKCQRLKQITEYKLQG